MAEISKNKMNWKIMIPVMLFAIFQSGLMSFSSVLADIARQFPDAPKTLIQMIMTIPSTVTIPVSLIVGILASYITKKNLVLFALVAETIGGLLPVFFHESIYSLIWSAALIGVGQGFLISIATAILAEHFDGNTRGWSMGLKQAASSVGIAGLTVATGYLCTIAWYKAYYVYLAVIPIIALTVVLLPKGKLDVKLVGNGADGLKRVFTPGMIYMCILFFFLGAFNFAFYTNIGMSMMSKQLGDASVIGRAISINSILTIIIGIGFALVLKSFKKYTLASCMIITALSFFVLYSAGTVSMIVIGSVIYGIGAGIQMPGSVYYVTEAVDSEASTMAIAVSMVAISLGISLSPVVVNGIVKMFGEVDGTNGLMVAGVAYIIMFVIEVAREAVFNKESKIGMAAEAA